LDGTFTCTLFAPLKGENSFLSFQKKEHIDSFFETNFNDVHKLVPDISDQYFHNPLSSLGFVRCETWHKNNFFLIGDACHATVPFYGQGMNAGFEDCYLLNQCINLHHGLDKNKFNKFSQQRVIDTLAMQDLSMNNFIEMSNKTGDVTFLLQKKIEKWFSDKHPQKWTPLYSMVTFSHIGYNKALQKGKIQDQIMQQIMKKNQLFDRFSIQELEEKNIESQILSNIK